MRFHSDFPDLFAASSVSLEPEAKRLLRPGLISCSQSFAGGASSTRRVSCGLIHFGGLGFVPTRLVYMSA